MQCKNKLIIHNHIVIKPLGIFSDVPSIVRYFEVSNKRVIFIYPGPPGLDGGPPGPSLCCLDFSLYSQVPFEFCRFFLLLTGSILILSWPFRTYLSRLSLHMILYCAYVCPTLPMDQEMEI